MTIHEQLSQGTFSPTEELIARYMLEEAWTTQSARFMAARIGVAPSTITRFIKKLGYEHYRECAAAFKKEEDINAHTFEVDPNYPFDHRDKNHIIAAKIGQLYKDIIDETLLYMTHDGLSAILSQMRRAKRLIVVSAGVQGDVAKIFEDKMLRIGKDVIVEDKLYQAYTRASLCDHETMFILISYSGKTESMIRVAQKLAERQISMLAITSNHDSPLSAICSHKLYVSSKESLYDNLGSYTMNVSTMLLLDILYTALFNEDYKHHHRTKKSTLGFDQFRQ